MAKVIPIVGKPSGRPQPDGVRLGSDCHCPSLEFFIGARLLRRSFYASWQEAVGVLDSIVRYSAVKRLPDAPKPDWAAIYATSLSDGDPWDDGEGSAA